MIFNTHNLVNTQQVLKLPDGNFLLSLDSSPDDDGFSTNVWGHYREKEFEFSNNIQIVAASTMLNSVAIIVKKTDPNIVETFILNDPDNGEIDISF